MFDDIRQFQGLICSSPYDDTNFSGNVFCTWSRDNTVYNTEWPAFTGSITTVYDPFGDGKGFGATSFDTTTDTPPSSVPSS
mmetsp:Transcript_11496/g.24707  ORF Transcript_11496/g.24707 Transcript_11496/m.24707 type:complete len:81 (-) Transcript_11496:113-355(-)